MPPCNKVLDNTITDFLKVKAYYAVKANKDTLWTPGANDGAPSAVPVLNLLAIPNALVNLLCTQGPAITSHDVLKTVASFIQSSGHPQGQQWECIHVWCLVACQTGNRGKSKVFLDIVPVIITIDDEEFDRWVGNKLNSTLGPQASGAPPTPTTAAAGTQTLDYITMSKMLASTIRTNMMQFSQAM